LRFEDHPASRFGEEQGMRGERLGPIGSVGSAPATLLLLAVAPLVALALLSCTPRVGEERGDDAERASKNGKVTGTLDGVAVTLEYGRPKVKGRPVWGELVPYGEVWRTGADEATTIAFSADVLVEGERLPAGTYGLFSIPSEGGWTWVFNSEARQWGAYDYDERKDVVRVTVQPATAEHVEEMDFRIDGEKVVLRWEKLAVPLRVKRA
jgi:hypothetical protein